MTNSKHTHALYFTLTGLKGDEEGLQSFYHTKTLWNPPKPHQRTHTHIHPSFSFSRAQSATPACRKHTRLCSQGNCVCVCVPVSYCSAGLAEEATSWGTNREHQLLSLPKHTHRVAAHCCSSGSRSSPVLKEMELK